MRILQIIFVLKICTAQHDHYHRDGAVPRRNYESFSIPIRVFISTHKLRTAYQLSHLARHTGEIKHANDRI